MNDNGLASILGFLSNLKVKEEDEDEARDQEKSPDSAKLIINLALKTIKLDSTYRKILEHLRDNQQFLDKFAEFLSTNPSSVVDVLPYLQHLQERKETELSLMQESYNLGVLFREEILRSTPDIKNHDEVRREQTYCPFRKDQRDGSVYYILNENNKMVSNTLWTIERIELWKHLLAEKKQQEYKQLKPLENPIRAFWAGVANEEMGELLPPYHPILMIRLLNNEDYSVCWMGYDNGNHGIGMSTYHEKIPNELPTNFFQDIKLASLVHTFNNPIHGKMGRPLQLYDLLGYGWIHSQPVSLPFFLDKYPDNPVKAITLYCNLNCWTFAQGAIDLFSDFNIEQALRQE